MILIQAIMFVIPAIVSGFLICFPALYFLYTYLLTKELGIPNDPIPDSSAIVQSIFIGVLIPLLASIIPIK